MTPRTDDERSEESCARQKARLRTRRASAARALAAAWGGAPGRACSSAPAAAPEDDTSTEVAFADCAAVACEGSIDGAAYRILLPDTWNGTLLLWSHGYRSPQPAPPAFGPVLDQAEPAPGWDGTSSPIADELLAQGYALAGSAYASNGWAVADGIKAGEDLHCLLRREGRQAEADVRVGGLARRPDHAGPRRAQPGLGVGRRCRPAGWWPGRS